jgi:predicted PurR-regulated permease PerM
MDRRGLEKQTMNDARFRKGFLLALVIAVTGTFVFVIKDFLMTLFVAGIFSGLTHPLYLRLVKALGGRKALAAILTLLIVVLLVGAPLVFVLSIVTNEAISIADNVTPVVKRFISEPTSVDSYLDRIFAVQWLAPYRETLLTKAGETAGSLSRVVVSSLTSTTRGTFSLIIDFFMMLYAMFFFLIKGRHYLDQALQYLPLRESEQRQMLERFNSVARATLKGTLLIAIVQGTLGGTILAILGIPAAVLWGLLMTVLSLLPLIGGAIVWVPVSIVLAVQGAWVKALILVVFCSLVIGSVDNLLRPRFVGRDTGMSDLLVLFSTLGGISVFGGIGFLVGPLVAALFVTIWDIFGQVYRDDLDVERPAHIQLPP